MAEPQVERVTSYLEARGLTPAQIQRVLFQYEQAEMTQGAAHWPEQSLTRWLDQQVQNFATPSYRSNLSVAAEALDQRSDQREGALWDLAEQTRMAAAERRLNQQNRFFDQARIDYGSGVDPDVITNSISEGQWVDDEGNYIDPDTGKPLPPGVPPVTADADSVWQRIKGQTFNMGALQMPGIPREELTGLTYGRHTAGRRPMVAHPSADAMAGNVRQRGASYTTPAGHYPSKPRRHITPSQALSLLSSMSEDYLIMLQHQMFEAGLFEEDTRPRWGIADFATRTAFKNLFIEASQYPDKNMAAVLSDLAIDQRDGRPSPPGSPGAGAAGLPTLVLPDFEPEVMNEEALRQQIRDIASESIGGYLPDDQQEALIARLREREVGLQRQQYDRDVARVREQYTAEVGQMGIGAGQGGGSLAEVDAFLAALSGQESGGDYTVPNRSGSGAYGKYQIMPGNWPEWSRRAGLPPGSRQTPQNQEIVARQIVMDYFEQFGNWRDVAVAWYAGPGNIAGKRYSTRRQSGGPSISTYADSVMSRMGQQRRGSAVGGGMVGPTVGGQTFGPLEHFDPAAEAEAAIKAANPAAWRANEWGGRATEFFSALASVIGAG